MTTNYKYIIEFCGKAVQLKNQSTETVSMVMLLSTRLLLENAISDDLLYGLHLKLVKKYDRLNDKGVRLFFDFTLIVWQRRPECIKSEILSYLQNNNKFMRYIL